MLTRSQKEEQVKQIKELLKNSSSFLLADFSKVSIKDLVMLRRTLREAGAKFHVLKKRLLKIAFVDEGINYDPTQFEAQTGIIFIPQDVLSVAGPVYKISQELAKQDKTLKILGGYDMKENREVNEEEFAILAKLPSRETLLAQIAIVLSMPMRKLAYGLSQIKK